jgi:hypothetical protein
VRGDEPQGATNIDAKHEAEQLSSCYSCLLPHSLTCDGRSGSQGTKWVSRGVRPWLHPWMSRGMMIPTVKYKTYPTQLSHRPLRPGQQSSFVNQQKHPRQTPEDASGESTNAAKKKEMQSVRFYLNNICLFPVSFEAHHTNPSSVQPMRSYIAPKHQPLHLAQPSSHPSISLPSRGSKPVRVCRQNPLTTSLTARQPLFFYLPNPTSPPRCSIDWSSRPAVVTLLPHHPLSAALVLSRLLRRPEKNGWPITTS